MSSRSAGVVTFALLVAGWLGAVSVRATSAGRAGPASDPAVPAAGQGVPADTCLTCHGYGLETEVRPNNGTLTITPGWSRRTADRNIEFGDVPQQRSLFRADSASDEIFVRTQWKVSRRLSLRATPSVLWADEVGYVTEPERAAKMNLALSYANAGATRSATAFYTIRTRRNDSLSFTGVDAAAVRQDARGSLQQLGAAGTVTPRETTNVFWSYAWSRDEYNADLIGVTVRRYDAAPVFYSRGDPARRAAGRPGRGGPAGHHE